MEAISITDEDIRNSAIFSREETLSLRSQLIPKACGMHFERAPLKLTRAQGTYLYSDVGEEYLDCVNCVAHVGHCHPAVVNAGKVAMLQVGMVNFGMNDLAAEYVAKLKTTLPSDFDTFLFVSSGSEANDLAIQIARMYTGGHDVVAVEREFHGSLSCTNDVSPRQYHAADRIPEWVHIIPCPDLYRGKFRESDPKAVEKYCYDAQKIMQDAVASNKKLACFICEPIMTIPGVIIPPSEWMQSVYRDIRALGGLAIADEAQSGLGRCGTSWWSMQFHENAIPDILTIGKPLGNGFPTAVVVTRSSIAAKLGAERLASFRCDAVSAAIGLAVINTVRNDSLLANARNVGTFLREGLRALAAEHPNIGHVRGQGFMIGVEIVYDRDSRKPAKSIAEAICYRLKEEYIIMANEGTYKNVLLMTPPMCFSCQNAHRVIVALDKILKEIETQDFHDDGHEPNVFSLVSIMASSSDRLISLGMLTQHHSGSKNEVDPFNSFSGSHGETNIFEAMD